MRRILIVDDDRVFSLVLSDIVSEAGHEAVCAGTLAEGLDLARSQDFDLVFLDVRLPDGNGLDLLPRLKTLSSCPEVIIMTGAGDPDGAELAISNGAWDYVEKAATSQGLKFSFLRALQYREKKLAAMPAKRPGIVGSSRAIRQCVEHMARAAKSAANVLILGETGTGKEIFAKAVHENSSRAGRRFVVVDCAALQETLLGSELFGHAKGAFTGAVSDRDGLIQRADHGTLFLDEVSEMSLDMQKSFLRLLENRKYRPLGEVKEVESDFRLVCASNRDLKAMVRQGDFREDLFYRIRTFTLELPALREHMEDLPELVEHHLAAITSKSGLPAKVLSPELEKLLYAYDWPGNVRELVNVLEVLVASAPTDDVLLPIYLPRELRVHFFRSRVSGGGKAADQPAPAGAGAACLNWAEFRKKGVKALERRFLEDLIRASNGELKKAMDLSGLSQARIYGMLKSHGLNLRERAKRARDMN